jgi:outer membrane lipoprotein LolB
MLQRCVLAFLIFTISACTGTAMREPYPADWAEQSRRLEALQHWSATGKVAVRSSQGAESANLFWEQREELSHVRLSGPLGAGATVIESDGQQLEIRRGNSVRTVDISSPEAISLNTGWDLPLHALPHWLKGLPFPGYEVQAFELDPRTERARSLRQNGWHVKYGDYSPFGSLMLPTRVEIRRDDTRATVLIRQWQNL